jgi:hypothetical protein
MGIMRPVRLFRAARINRDIHRQQALSSGRGEPLAVCVSSAMVASINDTR